MTTTPTIGQTVHWVSYGTGEETESTCRVAIVTETSELNPVVVGLAVFHPRGLTFERNVAYHVGLSMDVYEGGTWHYPEVHD